MYTGRNSGYLFIYFITFWILKWDLYAITRQPILQNIAHQ